MLWGRNLFDIGDPDGIQSNTPETNNDVSEVEQVLQIGHLVAEAGLFDQITLATQTFSVRTANERRSVRAYRQILVAPRIWTLKKNARTDHKRADCDQKQAGAYQSHLVELVTQEAKDWRGHEGGQLEYGKKKSTLSAC